MRKVVISLLLLLLFCSCSSQNKEYISVEQIDSNYPIRIGGDTTKNIIYQIGFPFVYKIKKNTFEKIRLYRGNYIYNAEYSKNRGSNVSLLSTKMEYLNKDEFLGRLTKEYIFMSSHIPDTTRDIKILLQPYLNRMRKEKKNTIYIESIQELKKTNPELLIGLINGDSIGIMYTRNENKNLGEVFLPVEMK